MRNAPQAQQRRVADLGLQINIASSFFTLAARVSCFLFFNHESKNKTAATLAEVATSFLTLCGVVKSPFHARASLAPDAPPAGEARYRRNNNNNTCVSCVAWNTGKL